MTGTLTTLTTSGPQCFISDRDKCLLRLDADLNCELE
jgi:hypothetical protein